MTATTLDEGMMTTNSLVTRASELFSTQWNKRLASVDRMFAALLAGQWVFAILLAVFFSPYGWTGKVKVIHTHVYIAVIMGAERSRFSRFFSRSTGRARA